MQQSGSVSFQGALVAQDLASAIRHATRRSWLHRLLIVWFLLLAVAFGANAVLTKEPATWFGLLFPMLFLGWLLGGASIQARSQFRQHKHLREPGTYDFDMVGLRISRPSLEVKFPWSAVSRIIEFEDQYLVYTSPKCFHVIPRRFLSDEQEWRELVAFGSGKPIEKS